MVPRYLLRYFTHASKSNQPEQRTAHCHELRRPTQSKITLLQKSITAQLKGGHRCYAKHKKSRLFPALLVRSLALTTRPFERIVKTQLFALRK
jgi:hypothetical protein